MARKRKVTVHEGRVEIVGDAYRAGCACGWEQSFPITDGLVARAAAMAHLQAAANEIPV
jgi:hypothetical protein